MKKILLFFFIIFTTVCQSNAATLHYGNLNLPLTTTKETSPALAVMLNGSVYYAPMINMLVPERINLFYNNSNYALAQWKLWYEESAINTCDSSVVLPRGIYRVELQGGHGGDGGNATNNGGLGVDAAPVIQYFNLPAATTVYIFRGGDGNNGSDGASNRKAIGGGGGGASGAGSIFVYNGNVVESPGGGGGRGGWITDRRNNTYEYGGGGGANNGDLSTGLPSLTNGSTLIVGGGGAGAPSGLGVAESNYLLYYGYGTDDATAAAGTNGGDADKWLYYGYGGNGGTSVTWSCGGQTIYSYGGGGGGGVVSSTKYTDGGNGGSGSTNTSTTSFVKIYKVD